MQNPNGGHHRRASPHSRAQSDGCPLPEPCVLGGIRSQNTCENRTCPADRFDSDGKPKMEKKLRLARVKKPHRPDLGLAEQPPAVTPPVRYSLDVTHTCYHNYYDNKKDVKFNILRVAQFSACVASLVSTLHLINSFPFFYTITPFYMMILVGTSAAFTIFTGVDVVGSLYGKPIFWSQWLLIATLGTLGFCFSTSMLFSTGQSEPEIVGVWIITIVAASAFFIDLIIVLLYLLRNPLMEFDQTDTEARGLNVILCGDRKCSSKQQIKNMPIMEESTDEMKSYSYASSVSSQSQFVCCPPQMPDKYLTQMYPSRSHSPNIISYGGTFPMSKNELPLPSPGTKSEPLKKFVAPKLERTPNSIYSSARSVNFNRSNRGSPRDSLHDNANKDNKKIRFNHQSRNEKIDTYIEKKNVCKNRVEKVEVVIENEEQRLGKRLFENISNETRTNRLERTLSSKTISISLKNDTRSNHELQLPNTPFSHVCKSKPVPFAIVTGPNFYLHNELGFEDEPVLIEPSTSTNYNYQENSPRHGFVEHFCKTPKDKTRDYVSNVKDNDSRIDVYFVPERLNSSGDDTLTDYDETRMDNQMSGEDEQGDQPRSPKSRKLESPRTPVHR